MFNRGRRLVHPRRDPPSEEIFGTYIREGNELPSVPSNPAAFRDSTQIVLPPRAIEDVREDLEERFTLTLDEGEEAVRIIASPVVIKEVSRFLARYGINLP